MCSYKSMVLAPLNAPEEGSAPKPKILLTCGASLPPACYLSKSALSL